MEVAKVKLSVEIQAPEASHEHFLEATRSRESLPERGNVLESASRG
jgi:hypothetical protein